MDRLQNWRMAQRDHGRRLLRLVTGWLTAAAVGLAAVFAVIFAYESRSAASTPAGTGTVQQQNEDNTAPGGANLQRPAQPPGGSSGGGGQTQSGGS